MDRALACWVAAVMLIAPIGAARAEDPPPVRIRAFDLEGQPIEGASIRLIDFNSTTLKESTSKGATLESDDPRPSGVYQVWVTLEDSIFAMFTRTVYVGDDGKLDVSFRVPTDPDLETGKEALEAGRSAAARGDEAAYGAAASALSALRDEAAASVTSLEDSIQKLERDLLANPSLVDRDGLVAALKAAGDDPKARRAAIKSHMKSQMKAADGAARAGVPLSKDLEALVQQRIVLRILYKDLARARQRRTDLEADANAFPDFKPAYEPGGSLVPAEPGGFYASGGGGLHWMNAPDFSFVTLADFNNQIVIQSGVLDFDNQEVGYGAQGRAGFVFEQAFLLERNWIEIGFDYADVGADANIAFQSAGGWDVEVFGPDRDGRTIPGPNADLVNVDYDWDYQHYAGQLDLFAELPPCEGEITLSPMVGVLFQYQESDAEVRFTSAGFGVSRKDHVESTGGGIRVGLYAHRNFGPVTLFAGGHVGGMYQDADGDSKLDIQGVFTNKKNLSHDDVTLLGGGAVGLRYDLPKWLSFGARVDLDYAEVPAIDYPENENQAAKLGFEGSLNVRATLSATLRF